MLSFVQLLKTKINVYTFIPLMHIAYFTLQNESLYDAAQNIDYLDMVWQESLRMYAPVGL